jgi:ABC-type Fe3+-hydroxamate transport system substrate-binding protein
MLHYKKLLLPFFIVAAFFILQGCNKNSSNSSSNNNNNNNNNNNGTIKDVYVAGYGINNLGKQVALLWKNDTVTYLTNGLRNAVANSVFVDGNNV